MFKGHPKGLYVAFFSNMGERFGYYTMLAIFTMYLQGKFGWNATETGHVFGTFLFGVYFLPLLGGYIADNILGYGKTIVIGIIIMFLGYTLMALPDKGQIFIYGALAVISLGTGLFKGNLQALVGNMYDDPKYSAFRDSAFNIFYMGINIGAFFAPSAATGMRNWFLNSHGFVFNADAADLAHKFNDVATRTPEITNKLTSIAQTQGFSDVAQFANQYIQALGRSYNSAFAIAAASMIVSLIIFLVFRKHYKHADVTHKQKIKAAKEDVVILTPKQTKDRLVALGLVFFVVMFFWMSFHQNGFTMTIFARDYTVHEVGAATYILFDLAALLPIIGAIIGLVFLLGKGKPIMKYIGGALVVVGFIIAYWSISKFSDKMPITAEIFQHFNPIFIVFLTPIIIGLFNWLRKRGKEPSTPKKIGIGMLITAIGFLILVIASIGLASPSTLAHQAAEGLSDGRSSILVTPYWLIGTYFTLTIAELFLSPMGISFVSKVAPPQYKGLMQGGWFGATAIGNLAAGFIGPFWDKWELWQFFAFLVCLCLLSALFIFSILKKLDRSTNS